MYKVSLIPDLGIKKESCQVLPENIARQLWCDICLNIWPMPGPILGACPQYSVKLVHAFGGRDHPHVWAKTKLSGGEVTGQIPTASKGQDPQLIAASLIPQLGIGLLSELEVGRPKGVGSCPELLRKGGTGVGHEASRSGWAGPRFSGPQLLGNLCDSVGWWKGPVGWRPAQRSPVVGESAGGAGDLGVAVCPGAGPSLSQQLPCQVPPFAPPFQGSPALSLKQRKGPPCSSMCRSESLAPIGPTAEQGPPARGRAP